MTTLEQTRYTNTRNGAANLFAVFDCAKRLILSACHGIGSALRVCKSANKFALLYTSSPSRAAAKQRLFVLYADFGGSILRRCK